MKSLIRKTVIAACLALGVGVALAGCTTYDDGHGHRHHGWRHYDRSGEVDHRN